jgi:hypothetical protein
MAGPTLTSTTSSEAEMTHALSPEWRDPAALPEPAKEVETETPETQETEPTAAASETAESKESPKPKSKAQRAIDKLTAKNYQLARDLEELRKAKPAEEKTASTQPGPPQLKDFKTPEEWADARDAWKDAETKRIEAEQERQEEFDEYNRGVSELQAKHDDWDEVVVNSTSTIPGYVGAAVTEMGKEGAEVAYFLGQHPEICDELMDMKKFAAIAYVHQIAAQLKAPAASPKPKPKVTPPAPISTVGASTTRSSIPLDQLPPLEYNKIRNQQERNKRMGR